MPIEWAEEDLIRGVAARRWTCAYLLICATAPLRIALTGLRRDGESDDGFQDVIRPIEID